MNPNQDTLFLFSSPNVVKNQINHSFLKEKSITHRALIYLQGWDSKQQGIFLVIVVFFFLFPGSAFPTISHSLDVRHKARSIRKCINKVRTLKSAVYICIKISRPLWTIASTFLGKGYIDKILTTAVFKHLLWKAQKIHTQYMFIPNLS